MVQTLAPVEKQTLAQTVMERLADYIRTGPLRPGEALPAQHDLARQLAVSRPVLREALQGLATAGMIEIRPGSGCYVRDERPATDVDALFEVYTHEAAVEALDARMVVEVELAAFAATRATARDIEAMEVILERLRRSVARGRPTAQITSDFHQALARAGHNTVLFRMARLLTRARLAQGLRVEQAMPDIAAGEHESHQALLVAVRSEDAAIAREAMREHLQLAHGWEERINELRQRIGTRETTERAMVTNDLVADLSTQRSTDG
jgi:DNA-binding FadR family transcriptional regulator